VTDANVEAIVAWAAGEGSCAGNNPLDTTQPKPGATPFNTLAGGGHVWNYPSPAVGLAATVETLHNGLYRPIVAALKASAGAAALEQAVRATPWGTGRFGSTTYAGPRCNGAPGAGGGASIPDAIAARAAQYEALAATMAGGVPPGATGSGHVLPVDRSWYEQHPDWFQRPHHDYPAVDIPVPAGTPVFAVAAGTVVAADDAGGTTSCGHDVLVGDANGVTFTYCHGSQVLVIKGQPVAAGQLLLRSGWSGAVVPSGPAGAHLHFQINLPGVSSTSCPQPALAAWASGRDVDLRQLPTTGCVSGHIG
jgi:murein DD-endopeptidase MepM/ murein hydrolase activator NlpD